MAVIVPTDLEMVAYLKLKTESFELYIPTWVVHRVDFWNHRPQKLAKDFEAASDGSWYFVSTGPTSPVLYAGWKELEIPISEKYVYIKGKPVAYKFQVQLVDKNQEWRMCVYHHFDLVDGKMRNERIAKMYKHGPEAIYRDSKRRKFNAPLPVRFMPTDQDACAYLKLKMESLRLSIPVWVVHELDFWKYTPQQLAESYESARDQDQTWYFVSPNHPVRKEWAVDWKRLDIPSRELVIHQVKTPVGLKLICEFLGENNQKWQLCFYCNISYKEKWKLCPGVLGKLKQIKEEERRSPGNQTIDIKECKEEPLTYEP